jgi:hypothetical protein
MLTAQSPGGALFLHFFFRTMSIRCGRHTIGTIKQPLGEGEEKMVQEEMVMKSKLKCFETRLRYMLQRRMSSPREVEVMETEIARLKLLLSTTVVQ